MIAVKILFAFALSAQASRFLESSAAFRAKLWLKTHEPTADEAGMNDLKNSDPNAYAIVQALLTKQSLGCWTKITHLQPSEALHQRSTKASRRKLQRRA